jgi:hypothetical protein
MIDGSLGSDIFAALFFACEKIIDGFGGSTRVEKRESTLGSGKVAIHFERGADHANVVILVRRSKIGRVGIGVLHGRQPPRRAQPEGDANRHAKEYGRQATEERSLCQKSASVRPRASESRRWCRRLDERKEE